MADLQYSSIEMIGWMKQGHHVKTTVLANATYMAQAQVEIFNVFGRIMVLQLYTEAVTAFGAQATDMLYNFTSATPGIAVQPMCAVNAGSMTGFAQGLRHVFIGGAVASLAVLTATAGISDVINVNPHIIGTDDGTTQGVGTIGQLTSTASQLSGTHQCHLHYIPMSDGAYCTNVL